MFLNVHDTRRQNNWECDEGDPGWRAGGQIEPQCVALYAPLSAITVAVGGVVVSLAVFFDQRSYWPDGLAPPPHWPSALLVPMACAVAAMVVQFL